AWGHHTARKQDYCDACPKPIRDLKTSCLALDKAKIEHAAVLGAAGAARPQLLEQHGCWQPSGLPTLRVVRPPRQHPKRQAIPATPGSCDSFATSSARHDVS